MSSPILVTGASGTLGRRLVRRLTAAGHEVRGLSRRPRESDDDLLTWCLGDLRNGARLQPAVDGVRVVVHCASQEKGDPEAVLHLLKALRDTQGSDTHVVYISIVGVDRIPYGYYRRKLAVEGILERSRQPYTVLRTTQFHELIVWLLYAQRRLPVLAVPNGFRVQPIDVRTVADRLVRLAAGAPAGRVDDLGGPEVLTARELAEDYLRARGRRRPMVLIPVPGPIGHAFRAGANLCDQHDQVGRTFTDFLTTAKPS